MIIISNNTKDIYHPPPNFKLLFQYHGIQGTAYVTPHPVSTRCVGILSSQVNAQKLPEDLMIWERITGALSGSDMKRLLIDTFSEKIIYMPALRHKVLFFSSFQ